MNEHRPYNVLFLCTGNSARSILAEAILNAEGKGKFKAYSAGSFPKGEVNPFAVKLLSSLNLPVDDKRSKSWDEFAKPGAPVMDFVFTVCDDAAGEVCPVWPGQPVTAHWGMPDPAAVDGNEATRMQAFRDTFRMLMNRIRIFTVLPFDKLDRLKLKSRLDEIGKS
jgi:protein-tyrosine-phosphatase